MSDNSTPKKSRNWKPKKCLACEIEFKPFSGRQKWCQKCGIVNRKEYMKALCQTEEYKASRNAYEKSPGRRARKNEYNQTSNRRAHIKAYNNTPERKAYMKEYMRILRQIPGYKENENARQSGYYQTNEYKDHKKKYMKARRRQEREFFSGVFAFRLTFFPETVAEEIRNASDSD